jgi:hypothetical protein
VVALELQKRSQFAVYLGTQPLVEGMNGLILGCFTEGPGSSASGDWNCAALRHRTSCDRGDGTA